MQAIYQNGQPVEQLGKGEAGMLVLDRTPFYAEGGGQVGDAGRLQSAAGKFTVEDTRKQGGKVFLHFGKVSEGTIKVGEQVEASVDAERRQATAYNHSATHLLHAALRQVLGDHVTQKGSLVEADRLRFDFSHFEPISTEQLQAIEALVNEHIRANHPVETKVMTPEDRKSVV